MQFPLFALIIMVMLNCHIGLPQHQPPLSKAQTTAFKNSLLKIGGVDARSLVEIKRRRIGYTLSIYFGVATTQIPAYFQKIVDIHSFVGATITQQLSNSATQQLSNSATQQPDCALINGQLLHSDNNIIIFSHFLQTAQAVLVFLLLHTDGTLLPWAYFVR